MKYRSLLAVTTLAAIASFTIPAFADEQSQAVKNCKQDSNCHVGKTNKYGGVTLYFGGGGSVIDCMPGKGGCIVARPAKNAKARAATTAFLGAASNQ